MKIQSLLLSLLSALSIHVASATDSGPSSETCESVAGSITGPEMVCITSPSGHQFTVNGSSANTGYTWIMPSGATIIAGQDTKTITVTFTSPGMGKNIFVSGNGISANHIVSVFAPISGTPVVNGPSSVCVSQSGVQFSLSNVTGNATGYSWVLPSGMTITSGASSANITVSTSSNFAGGQIIGYAIAGPCGSSPVGTKQISVASPLDTPGPITGPSTVDAGQSNVIYSVSPISG